MSLECLSRMSCNVTQRTNIANFFKLVGSAITSDYECAATVEQAVCKLLEPDPSEVEGEGQTEEGEVTECWSPGNATCDPFSYISRVQMALNIDVDPKDPSSQCT